MVRIADQHMYRVDTTTCRLQVFSRDATSTPVIAATQHADGHEQGPRTVTNAPAEVASAAWRDFLPDHTDPPTFVYRIAPAPGSGETDRTDKWTRVRLRRGPDDYALTRDGSDGMSANQLAEQAGELVDPDRGSGYRPPKPSLDREIEVFRTMPVVRLPRPRPFRATDCMPGQPSTRRLQIRARFQRRSSQPRQCCWYHAGDWHAANNIATDALTRAQQQVGRDPESDVLLNAARLLDTHLDKWIGDAAHSLLMDALWLDENGDWVNGQHRARAIAEAGVRRTVVHQLWVVREPTLPQRFFLDATDRDLRRRLNHATALDT